MRKKKIILVFGTRPEAIKMAPLIQNLKKETSKFDTIICVTSQHREMLDQVLKIFKIKPNIDLNLMKKNQNLSDLTSLILNQMNKVFDYIKPDLILVHGDTTSTFATALAAFNKMIPIGHVEAGLRTYNLKSPFPEEFNRQITSKLTKWHFAPTKLNQKNLLSEGISKSCISVTGNTVIDAIHLILNNLKRNKNYRMKIENILNKNLSFNWKIEKFILVTAHRRENFGNPILKICSAIKELALKYPHIKFVYPVHYNPNIMNQVYKLLGDFENINLIKPQEYDVFVYLLKYSYLVLTDSGGIQEEAPSFGKPVLVMRDVTERLEAIKAGTVKLVGSNNKTIIKFTSNLIDNKKLYQKMSFSHNPYGDGLASKRIIDILKSI